MKRTAIVLAIAMFLINANVLGQEGPLDRFQMVADRLVKAINAADYDAIGQDFAGIMQKAMPKDKLIPFFRALAISHGAIEKLDAGRFTPPHTVVFSAHFERGMLDIKIVLDQQDKIIGLWFLPHIPSIPVPKKHETKLSLPFEGEWLVYWGGDTIELNQHHGVPNQNFAFDFVIADKAGKTHKADGAANEDYYAFGKKILAPADGVVTDVIEGVRDNVPGSMNPYSALGNAVFIRHAEHEFSILAHFKLGSIKVKVGQKVKKGQLLGLCGNSGHSSEPHLHYHLQNTPIIQDGTGIKCRFEKLIIAKKGARQVKSEYSPIKGDLVAAE